MLATLHAKALDADLPNPRWFESDTFERLPRAHQVMGGVMSLVPAPSHAIANMAQYHRYAFGPV